MALAQRARNLLVSYIYIYICIYMYIYIYIIWAVTCRPTVPRIRGRRRCGQSGQSPHRRDQNDLRRHLTCAGARRNPAGSVVQRKAIEKEDLVTQVRAIGTVPSEKWSSSVLYVPKTVLYVSLTVLHVLWLSYMYPFVTQVRAIGTVPSEKGSGKEDRQILVLAPETKLIPPGLPPTHDIDIWYIFMYVDR